ncbi:hypothetical protein WA158_003839 [Blastocystis sp. Blastoise]
MLIETSPSNFDMSVSPSIPFSFKFSENVSKGEGRVILEDEDGFHLDITSTCSCLENICSCSLLNPLTSHQLYHLTLDSDFIISEDHKSLQDPVDLFFKTSFSSCDINYIISGFENSLCECYDDTINCICSCNDVSIFRNFA